MLAVRIAVPDLTRTMAREAHLEAHKRHLREAPLRILLSGPLVGPGGAQAGALVVAEVQDLSEMAEFSALDPFVRHGVYQETRILQWNVSLSHLDEFALPKGHGGSS